MASETLDTEKEEGSAATNPIQFLGPRTQVGYDVLPTVQMLPPHPVREMICLCSVLIYFTPTNPSSRREDRRHAWDWIKLVHPVGKINK